jgi:mRNA interferase RelE/StbE
MTVSYEMRFVRSFEKDLRNLSAHMIPVIMNKVLKLSDQPRPQQSKKLKGTKDEYRLRVGDYRVFYTIDDTRKIIIVFHVAHRREAYR